MKFYFTIFLALTISSTLFATDFYLPKSKELYTAHEKNADLPHHLKISPDKKISSYEVGDEKKFWRYDLTVMPPRWVEDNSICVASGNHSYIFVSGEQWEKNFTEDDADSILKYLEEKTFASEGMGIVETVTKYFGDIPDYIDNDPKVIFLFTALGSYKGSVFSGYFSDYNQFYESDVTAYGAHSNECEMLYMSCSPLKPAERSNMSAMAHELQHLIHWGYDWLEEQWVNEGCSQYAMVLCGLPDPITDFQNAPNTSLYKWNKKVADQVKVMLFFTYLVEHYGGADLMKNLVANKAVGVEGIISTLKDMSYDVTFQEVLADWSIANFIDDESLDGGKYNYQEFKVPPFKVTNKYNTFPFNKSSSLEGGSAQYYDLPTNFVKLELAFDFPDQNNWSTALIAYENGKPREVIRNTDGNFNFQLPKDYTLSRLALVVTNTGIDSTSRDYSFSANNITAVDDYAISNSNISVFPNPASDMIQLNYLTDQYEIGIRIFNALGSIALESRFNTVPGKNNLKIDTRSIQSGLYFMKISDSNHIETVPVVINR